MRARDLMTPDPIFVEAGQTMRQAGRLMHDYDLRHLPVVEDGALVGMLSDRDLRAYLPYVDQQVGADEAGLQRLDDPVTAVMQGDVLSVDAESDLLDVIDLILEHRVGAVPVIEQAEERLVGIVSYVDVLREARGRL